MKIDSEALKKTAAASLWPAYGENPNSYFEGPGSIVIAAEGPYVIDSDGNRYIDSGGGGCAATVGYNHPHIIEAMVKQMSDIVQTASGGPASIPQILLAEKIASLSPGSLKYTKFLSNGTDANEMAIRLARHYHKLQGNDSKTKIIGRHLDYFGASIATRAASAWDPSGPLPNGYIHIATPESYRCKYPKEHPHCGTRYAEELRQAIEREDPSTVACYIGEQTAVHGGILPPPPGYLQRIRKICNEYDVLMIVDEVVTGFGRTGAWFECQKYDFVPDILTTGKGMTGGHAPLSATHIKEEIAQAVLSGKGDRFTHGHTLGGMAPACAAALATIEYIENAELLIHVTRKSANFHSQLTALMAESPIVGDVRSHGMLFGVELVSNRDTKEGWPPPQLQDIVKTIVAAGRKNGVYLDVFTPRDTAIIKLAPPLNIEDAELDVILKGVQASVRQIESIQRDFSAVSRTSR